MVPAVGSVPWSWWCCWRRSQARASRFVGEVNVSLRRLPVAGSLPADSTARYLPLGSCSTLPSPRPRRSCPILSPLSSSDPPPHRGGVGTELAGDLADRDHVRVELTCPPP